MESNTAGLPVLHHLLELTQTHQLILCHPLLLMPSIFPSIRVFSKELALHIRWPNYWKFSFSISLSFSFDWFDLFAAQGILKSLLQHHSSKASVDPQKY